MRSITILILMTFVLISINSEEFNSDEILITGINVIPMNSERVLSNYSVLISKGKIKKISAEFNKSKVGTIINGEGQYLIPGLSDMHAHLFHSIDLDLFIANGVTLIRNMHGRKSHLKLRDKINSGKILGPEIWSGTPLIDGIQPMWGFSVNITDPKEVEKIITDLNKDGYDFVKTYNSLTLEVYEEIINVANKLGMKVAGHTSYLFEKEKTVRMGHYSDEHLTLYNLAENSIEESKTIVELALKRGLWNVPTMIAIKNNFEYDNFMTNGYKYSKYGPSYNWKSDWYLPYWNYERSVELINLINKKGGKIVAGSDNGTPYVISGIGVHEEIEIFSTECGLSNYESLKTATINAAKLLGIDNRLGSIEVGKDADLVILNKNPLEDIKNTMEIDKVIVKGKLLSREDLDNILVKAEEYFK